MDITAGKINKISDEGNTMMEVDLKRSLTYGAETTANGWPDGSYRMAGAEVAGVVHKAGEQSTE